MVFIFRVEFIFIFFHFFFLSFFWSFALWTTLTFVSNVTEQFAKRFFSNFSCVRFSTQRFLVKLGFYQLLNTFFLLFLCFSKSVCFLLVHEKYPRLCTVNWSLDGSIILLELLCYLRKMIQNFTFHLVQLCLSSFCVNFCAIPLYSLCVF